MAHQILRLHSLTDLARGTTANVEVVHGGSVRNQIAPLAEALVDLRVTIMQEEERVESEILGSTTVLSGAGVEVIGGLNGPPVERTETTALLLNSIRRFADPLGINLT